LICNFVGKLQPAVVSKPEQLTPQIAFERARHNFETVSAQYFVATSEKLNICMFVFVKTLNLLYCLDQSIAVHWFVNISKVQFPRMAFMNAN
jgi:hypothetical protein